MPLHSPHKPESLPDLAGKVYIVTGGNAGVGLETVHLFAAKGAKVYIAARSQEKCAKAIEEIKAELPEAILEFLPLDLQDLKSVVDAAESFKQQETRCHGLINNAGVMAINYMLTEDGYEGHIQTNYISHWLLTYHLLPLLLSTASAERKPGSARVVNLTSAAHMVYQIKGGVDLENINLKEENTKTMTRYAVSKLCNILHAKELDRKYGTGKAVTKNIEGGEAASTASEEGIIWTAAVHPGLVNTGLTRGAQAEGGAFLWATTKFMLALNLDTAAEKSAYGSVYAACSPNLKSGSYMVPVAKVGSPARSGNDKELAKNLWDWTEAEMRNKGFV